MWQKKKKIRKKHPFFLKASELGSSQLNFTTHEKSEVPRDPKPEL